jgi:hypothetical protein
LVSTLCERGRLSKHRSEAAATGSGAPRAVLSKEDLAEDAKTWRRLIGAMSALGLARVALHSFTQIFVPQSAPYGVIA